MVKVDMKKVGVVFRREYLERVRSKWFLIGTLLGPVFFGAITVLPAYISMKQGPAADLANVIVIDASGNGLGSRVAMALAAKYPTSPKPTVKIVTPDRLDAEKDSATSVVVRKTVNGFIVLDSSTVANKSVYYAGRNAGSFNDVDKLMSGVRQAVLAQRLETEGLNPERITALTAERLETVTEKIGARGAKRVAAWVTSSSDISSRFSCT